MCYRAPGWNTTKTSLEFGLLLIYVLKHILHALIIYDNIIYDYVCIESAYAIFLPTPCTTSIPTVIHAVYPPCFGNSHGDTWLPLHYCDGSQQQTPWSRTGLGGYFYTFHVLQAFKGTNECLFSTSYLHLLAQTLRSQHKPIYQGRAQLSMLTSKWHCGTVKQQMPTL